MGSIRERVNIQESIAADESDVLNIEVAKAKSGELPIGDVLTLLKTLIEQDDSKEKVLCDQIDRTDKELEIVNSKLGIRDMLAGFSIRGATLCKARREGFCRLFQFTPPRGGRLQKYLKAFDIFAAKCTKNTRKRPTTE